jgi:hypothetical protein
MASKWSDNWGEKFVYLVGVLFILLLLAGLFSGEIKDGFGSVDNFEIDTVPPVSKNP